jgi:hypothetical protein
MRGQNGDSAKTQAVKALSGAILTCFEALAKIEAISTRLAIEQWIAAYDSRRKDWPDMTKER